MLNSSSNSAVKLTVEINQETNLDELMAHLCLMQGAFPAQIEQVEGELPDFTIHEGELEPAMENAFHSHR